MRVPAGSDNGLDVLSHQPVQMPRVALFARASQTRSRAAVLSRAARLKAAESSADTISGTGAFTAFSAGAADPFARAT